MELERVVSSNMISSKIDSPAIDHLRCNSSPEKRLYLSSYAASHPGHSNTIGMTSPTITQQNLVGMWGVGGFTTPVQPSPSPAVYTARTIASSLGNPQMPTATLDSLAGNCRKPMSKQHITEEKVSAHLNSLHLSESYRNHRLGKRRVHPSSLELVEDIKSEKTELPGLCELVKASENPKEVKLAEEIKQIIPGEDHLPASLIRKFTRPSMEVVLWSPPPDLIKNIISTPVDSEVKSTYASDPQTIITEDVMEDTFESRAAEPPSGQSPDSGISLSSPPHFLCADSTSGNGSISILNSTHYDMDDEFLNLPSTSSGIMDSGHNPFHRPSSPLPDIVEEDVSDRMEFNNNNGSAPDFMWFEENNNSALINLNTVRSVSSSEIFFRDRDL